MSVMIGKAVESMFAYQFQVSFSCLRKLFIVFIVHSLITYGFAKDNNKKATTKKILLGGIQKEGKIKIPNAALSESVVLNKSKISNVVKAYNDVKKQKSDSLRQRRNTVLDDEDLFEFMVRIANTPAEWERIRRVLSRIKLYDSIENSLNKTNDTTQSLFDNTEVSTVPGMLNKTIDEVRIINRENRSEKTNVSTNDLVNRSNDAWPSNEWITKLIKCNITDDYFESDEDYLDSEDDGEADKEEKNKVTDMIAINNKRLNKTINAIDKNKIVLKMKNSLPNFVYTRVLPNPSSSRVDNSSAYIAVSVVSPTAVLEAQQGSSYLSDTSTESRDDQWSDNYEKFEKLQTRRRHSRRKYDNVVT